MITIPLVALLGAGGCDGWNAVEHGRYDVLTFTPSDCARSSCDLDDPIAVGGAFSVKLEAVDGGSVGGLTLISSDPYVMDVYLVDWGSFSAEYEVVGYNEGWADVIAIDGGGYEIDYITVRVEHAERLTLDAVRGNAAPAAGSLPGAEVWEVTAGELVGFDVEATADEWEMMGRLALDVFIDQALLDAMDEGARLTEGHLSFRAPAGTHSVTFVGVDGATLNVRFIAR